MSSIAPPTGGGNAKYVLVVVLLLGGIAGLLIWRYTSQKPTEPIVIHAPDASAPTTPRIEDDEVPPPPPIVDAGPEPRIRNNAGGTEKANCNAPKCSGTSTPDLETALAFRAKQARRCYDSALENDSTLKGKVSISVRVASNGQVCSAGIASNDMGNTSVAQCVANKFRQTGYFPAPKGGCVDLAVPIAFIPGGK